MGTSITGNELKQNSQKSKGNISWYRGFIQGKTRITLAWVFAIVLGFSAREYPIWPGVLLCFLGAALRFWASGFLRKDSRLAVGGPYAIIRNPLYLGTYLMALGAVLAIQSWIFLAVVSILFAAIYHFIILDEEIKLKKMFKESYELYCATIPRFFPIPFPLPTARLKQSLLKVNPEKSHHHFSMKLAMQNKAYEAFASFFGIIGFISGIAFLWKQS